MSANTTYSSKRRMDCDSVAREEIVESYVVGRLSEEDREAFEEHYFECERCFDELRALQIVQAELPQADAESAPRTWRPLLRWAGGLAAAAVLVVAVGLWIRPTSTGSPPALVNVPTNRKPAPTPRGEIPAGALVAQAPSTIQQASIPQLVYQSIRLELSGDSPVRLDTAAGAGQVFRRRSGTSLSKPMPRIYTAQAFKEVAAQSSKLKDEIFDLYEKDYIAAWDGILNDIELVPFPNLAATSRGLATLAEPRSPLRGILKIVDDNTYLVPPAEPSKSTSPVATVKGKLEGIFQDVQKDAGLSTRVPGVQVTEYFARIHQIVGGEVGKAPVDGIISKIGEIQKQLASIGNRYGEVSPLEALTRAGHGDLLRSLEQDAATMPPQVRAIVAQITGRAASAATVDEFGAAHPLNSEFMNRYRREFLAPCRELIFGKYPLYPSSQTDVSLGDFGRVFGQDGVFDRFFKANLQSLVDTTRRPWALREDQSGGSDVISPFMRQLLRQFEAAQRIRERFFGDGGQVPKVPFTVTPTNMDAALARFVLEIDGQQIVSERGPERPQQVVWPGPMPGVAAASFEGRAGGRPTITFQGPWAWFRLLDVSQIRAESVLRYEVTFEKGGYTATVRIEAASVLNPFGGRELQQLRCDG